METARLRYNKNEDGTFVNRTPIILNGELLKVELEGLNWKVKAASGVLLDNGLSKNNADLKKAVKTSLKKLGVNFLDEIRAKKEKV